MNKDQSLQKYLNKITLESIILSVIFGLIIGLGVSFLLSIIFYLFTITLLSIIPIIGGVSSVIGALLLYFIKFKPNLKVVARRVDQIGLEERVITMLELENHDSFMAHLQRKDAKAKLQEVTPKVLPFQSFKKPVLALLSILIVTFISLLFLSQEVYAKYTKQYEIQFNTQGGTLVEAQLVSGGEIIEVPKNPKKEGFDFIYWYEKDINVSFDFGTQIFEDKTLYAKWEEKSDEDKIIEQLIKGLRGIVDRANVSEELKADLHAYIDALEEDIKRDDTLETKLAKIEHAREEILRRIQEEIDSIKIIKIGEALKEFETTFELGDAILTKKPKDIDDAIDHLVETLLSIEDRAEEIEALLQTADDIEEALEIATEENPRLRETLQDLADYLRYLAKEIIEGEEPEDVLDNEFIEEMEETKEELKDALGEESQTPEEELQEDVEEEFEEAIDELTGNEENEEEEENETGNGSGNEQGEDGNPFPEDLIPSVIDGKTQYISMLESLKEQAGQKLLDPTLTQEQRDALNKYINNIDMELEGLK